MLLKGQTIQVSFHQFVALKKTKFKIQRMFFFRIDVVKSSIFWTFLTFYCINANILRRKTQAHYNRRQKFICLYVFYQSSHISYAVLYVEPIEVLLLRIERTERTELPNSMCALIICVYQFVDSALTAFYPKCQMSLIC